MSNVFQPFGGLGEPGQSSSETTTAVRRTSRKTTDLSLDDLYAKVEAAGKVNPSVRTAIMAKDDFTSVNARYCDRICGLCTSSRRPKQVNLLHRKVDIMVIQDFPAPDDRWKSGDRIERVYQAIAGSLASKYFQGLNYSVVDALKCRPGAVDIKSQNVTITKARPCSAYLLEEIRQAKPSVIVVTGSNTLKVLGFKMSNTSNRGEITSFEGIPVVVTLHPKVTTMIRQTSSGKMWGPDYLEVIDRDFKKAADLARGTLVIPDIDEAIELAKENIWVTRSLEEVEEAIALIMSLPEKQVISYDLETSSLDPWATDAKILTAQFGFRDGDRYRAIVIPLWHRENKMYDPDAAWVHVAKPLVRPCPKVGHNLKFDILFTAVRCGVRLVNACFDTLLLLHALNSGLKGNYGLKRAVWDWLPETGLGGYEDKLPPLTRGKKNEIDGDEEDEVLEEEDSNADD